MSGHQPQLKLVFRSINLFFISLAVAIKRTQRWAARILAGGTDFSTSSDANPELDCRDLKQTVGRHRLTESLLIVIATRLADITV